MSTPKISIIVPVYNAEKTLRRCLDSFFEQHFSDWECIVVNDGSTDNSACICDNYASKDSRFRIIHKTNEGVSVARNIGVDTAKGEWITFVDSDDWLDKEMLMLPSFAEKDADLLFVDCLIMKGCDSYVDHYDAAIYSKSQIQSSYHKLMFRQSMLGPWAKFFRREIILKNNLRFDQNIKWAEDRLFNLQFLSNCNKIQLMGKGSYVYMFPNSESSIMKYHPTVPMIHDLYKKMREASMKLNAIKGELAYMILWQTIEKVALLSDLSQEKYRKAFFRENTNFHNLSILPKRDIPYFLLCAFTPRCFHKYFLLKKLGIKKL